jgi:hypothetical protein
MVRSPVILFAARAALFVALQCGICAMLVRLTYRSNQDGYMSATIDKHARLDALRGERRLFVAGGSASAFGFDSGAIEAATGRKVVNVGLHAELGLPFILAEAESAVVPGDVVWLSPELHLFNKQWEVTEVLCACLCARPAGVADLRHAPLKPLLDHGPQQFAGHVVRAAVRWLRDGGPATLGLYRRSAFDERGDFVAHVGRQPVRPLDLKGDGSTQPEDRFRASLATLRRVVRACEQKGAEVRIVLPPVHEEVFRRSGGNVEEVVAALEREFPGRLIEGLAAAVEPDDHFFDTSLHLTREAATARTKRLLSAAGLAGGEASGAAR